MLFSEVRQKRKKRMMIDNHISESDCDTLDPSWSSDVRVMVKDMLPFHHGEDVDFTCPAGRIKTGGDWAICLYGLVLPYTTRLDCVKIGRCFYTAYRSLKLVTW